MKKKYRGAHFFVDLLLSILLEGFYGADADRDGDSR